MDGIVEIIRMKMRPEVSLDEVLAASDRATELFQRMPGLRRRVLLGPDDAGMWTDISEFEDDAAIERARTIAHEQPGDAAEYFGLVDMPTLTYERLALRTDSAAGVQAT